MRRYTTFREMMIQVMAFLIVFLYLNTGVLMAQNTGVNLALNGPGSASSVESAAYPADNAFDGNPATKWSSSSSGYNQWLDVDLGSAYIIDQVVIKWADTYYSGSFDIQASSDSVSWSTISTVNNAESRLVDSILELHGTARYIRFNGRGRAGGNAGSRYRIGELEVYGRPPEATTPDQQISIDTVTGRLIRTLIPGTVNESNVTAILAAQQPDGSWPTIDYDTVALNFPAGAHLNNLKVLAIAYRTPGNTYYQSADVRMKILRGLRFFKDKNPQSTNWWYNDIGAPQDYMIPVILLKGEVPTDTLLYYSRYLRDQLARFKGEAKNLSWIANICMYKSCIENDYPLLDASFKAIYSSLVIVPGWDDEGIKIDNSFHQHHAQLYTGGYGMSIMSDFAATIQLAEGTEFINSISAENRQVLSNVLLHGHQLLGYRNMIDFGSMGRNISTQTTSTYNNISADVLSKMGSIDASHSSDYQAWQNHLSGGPFPAAFQGNNYFWKSDIMTQHGENYYLSAKVISSRTYGTESLNGENTKGHNLPLGATNIVTDGLEYNTIAPIWDWCRIPGTTALQNQDSAALDGFLIGHNDFAGGVTDGQNGILAFDNNYGGVKAKKAYFFMEDVMFCLGTGISSELNDPVYTSVNQCFQSGDIVFEAGGEINDFKDESHSFTNVNWVYHREVGYIFPNAELVTLQSKQQTGTWKSININGSTEVVSRNVFSLWTDHGTHPVNDGYAYIVVPGKTLTEFETYAAQNSFDVIRNDTNIQAIKNSRTHQYGIVFYHPGVVELGDGLAIRSNQCAVVLLSLPSASVTQSQAVAGGFKIAVADPLYKSGTTIELAINKQLTGAGATFSGDSTYIQMTMPAGDSIGGTRMVNLEEAVALPVHISDFQLRKADPGVYLSWKLYSGQYPGTIDILRSGDGLHFKKLGTVVGEKPGWDLNTGVYSYDDPVPGFGDNYYQLRSLDGEGKIVSVSGVKSIHIGIEQGVKSTTASIVKVYPNPATSQIWVLTAAGGYDKAEVLSANGVIIKRYRLQDKSLPVRQKLNISLLPQGVYFLRLCGEKDSALTKFIKK